MWLLVWISQLCLLTLSSATLQLDVVNEWNYLNFDLPYRFAYASEIRLENTVFTGLEVSDDRFFIATPRLRAGVPATLSTIPRHVPRGSGPTLSAYPNWEMHGPMRGNVNCSQLISVYRMKMDSCQRLWVSISADTSIVQLYYDVDLGNDKEALDSGVMDSLDDFTRICQPKLVVIDTLTDQIVRTVIFPNGVLRPSSLLTNLVVDETVQGTCDSAFIYMTDTASPGLIVYDGLKDQAWRLSHPTMFPDPDHSDYNINGETFTLMDGIVGITHSPRLATVYYQPLATDRIYSIPTSTLIKGPPGEFERLPVSLVGRKSSQGIGLTLNVFDNTLYFSPLQETSVASWNPLTNRQHLLAYDPERLQFLTDMRWQPDGSVWCLSTRFQRFFLKTISSDEINLRIIRVPTHFSTLDDINNDLIYK